MRLAGREGEMDRQAIGVHDRVNLARQASSRATHVLVIVVRDTGSVLMHAHDGGIDHPHRRVVTGSQRTRWIRPKIYSLADLLGGLMSTINAATICIAAAKANGTT